AWRPARRPATRTGRLRQERRQGEEAAGEAAKLEVPREPASDNLYTRCCQACAKYDCQLLDPVATCAAKPSNFLLEFRLLSVSDSSHARYAYRVCVLQPRRCPCPQPRRCGHTRRRPVETAGSRRRQRGAAFTDQAADSAGQKKG